MSQHGRRRAAPAPVVEDAPVRRFGVLTVESALVLGLAALIVLGSVLVSVAFPTQRETETVIGDKKVRITTVGKGGVEPGPVQPRVIPVVVPTPVPAAQPVVKPRKQKPVAGTATPTPTPEPDKKPGGGGGGPIITPPADGEGCTVLILCKPGQKPAPTPEPTQSPEPQPVPDPALPPATE